MPLSRSSRSVRIGRGFGRLRAGKLSRVVRTEPTPRSSHGSGSSLDTAEPTDSTERFVDSEAHALMSQLTSHLSSTLASFVGQLKEELSSLRIACTSPEALRASSTLPVISQPLAACPANNRSSPISDDCTPSAEPVLLDSKQPFPCKTDDVARKDSPLMYSDPACSPDYWITDLRTSERISNSVPPSWLNEMAPAISIEPFDGDPLKWDMFISSFKSLVHDVVGSDAQRLAILRQLLSPVLRSALASSLQSPETYAVVLRDLRRLYGNTNAVVAASLRRLSCIEPMKARCDLDVERFYLELHGALNILRSRGRFVELRSAYTLQSVVPKLTYRLQHKWAQRAFDVRPKEATIEDLDSWLEQIVLMNRMVESAEPQKGELLNVKRSLPQVALKNRRRHLNLAMIADKEVQCVLCQDAHLLSMCPQFTNATPNQRAEILKEHGRCFACLDGVHQARHCPRKVRCSAPRCSQRHHHLLHGSSRVWPTAVDSQALVNPGDSRTATIGTNTVGCDSICLSVVPITVFADTLSVQTFALLDPGSQGTLVTDEVVRRLNLKKNSSNIRISTFHGNDPSLRVFSVDFSIRGRKDGQRFEVNGALVVPSLNLSSHVVNWNEERCKWPHLRDLPLNAIDYKKVSVLIGADNFDIMQPLELRKPPRKGQPFGVLTPLGWTVIGKLPQMFKPSQYSVGRTVNEIIVKKDGNFESELEIYERFWDTESFGTKPGANCRNIDLSLVSWPSSFEFSGGRYEVGLLWKTGNIALPNNRAMANGRFISLRKRLLGDPKLYGLYREAISSLSRSGIIRMVTTHEMNQPVGRVWYLPHHPVRHPLKPDKVRIVFDASAKFEGLSLNDQLSKGPDLTNDMTSILVRFRLLPVAVTSDVASMFHQVGVPPHDRSVLRFLWSGTVDTAPKTYEFTRQVFGLTSAPASCIYALTRCIHDFLPSEMASRLSRQFYVDNYLDSFLTSNEAIAHCVALKEATSKGGFPLVKWASTSSDVLRSFPENDCSQSNVDLSFGTHQMEGVLGLFWDCAKDVLRFPVNLPAGPVRTKRELFSSVARLYDPMGLLAPVVVKAKWMMRQATCETAGWDTVISSDVQREYQRWMSDLQLIRTLSISRWLGFTSITEGVQLHVFADASDLAFGAVVYVRFVKENGCVSTSLVMSKSRIAPRRILTIPRLELQAAVLAVRVGQTAAAIVGIDPHRTTYWTDSMTVLKWLKMENRRLKPFVAHRVAEILSSSAVRQWRHVPGNWNPADDVSRGLSARRLVSTSHRWFTGPQFLRMHERLWPENPVSVKDDLADSEMVAERSHVNALNVSSQIPILRLFDVISDFSKTIRVVAYMYRFTARPKCPYPSMVVSGWEVNRATTLCILVLQREYFAEELKTLSKQQSLGIRSTLSRLDPFVDKDGLLRVGGRLRHADLPTDTKQPVILPASSSFVHRLIWQKHLELMHAKTERVLAELRGQFWLLGGRRSIRKVIDRCLYCRRMSSTPSYPIMAPLPPERLTCSSPAFVNVGVDCFGPFQVIVKRSLLKRYGCIFSCFASRASHLEVLHSLDTHSFMLALRRFIARRGLSSTIFSDNWRNFVAAETILHGISKDDHVRRYLADRQIEWKFMPPNAPHFGGTWERLIAVAKKALMAVLRGNTVTDELLTTVFAEVESLLNGRPLAYIGTDPAQPEPLTPFLLLTGRANVHVPPDVLCDPKCTIQKHWTRAVEIADRFYRRWQREYLPTLQGRSKWTSSNQDIQVDDVVLVVEPTSPRGHWPIGRVVQVFPGCDSRVRVASVRTKHGIYKRPVAKLAILERARDTSE